MLGAKNMTNLINTCSNNLTFRTGSITNMCMHTPRQGEVFYCTDTQQMYIYMNNEWLNLGTPTEQQPKHRCEYCGTRILDENLTHCKSCGAPI